MKIYKYKAFLSDQPGLKEKYNLINTLLFDFGTMVISSFVMVDPNRAAEVL